MWYTSVLRATPPDFAFILEYVPGSFSNSGTTPLFSGLRQIDHRACEIVKPVLPKLAVSSGFFTQ
jgi:hypothetical protein